MGRLLLLAALAVVLAVVLAGCGDSVPGGKVVTPTPATVIGALPKPPYEGGNAAAGKLIFSASPPGCAECHTYAPAGSTATIGPNLDDLASYAAKGGASNVDEYVYNAIVSPPAPYVPKGFTDSMPQTFGASLKPAQLADLVAFLTQRS